MLQHFFLSNSLYIPFSLLMALSKYLENCQKGPLHYVDDEILFYSYTCSKHTSITHHSHLLCIDLNSVWTYPLIPSLKSTELHICFPHSTPQLNDYSSTQSPQCPLLCVSLLLPLYLIMYTSIYNSISNSTIKYFVCSVE